MDNTTSNNFKYLNLPNYAESLTMKDDYNKAATKWQVNQQLQGKPMTYTPPTSLGVDLSTINIGQLYAAQLGTKSSDSNGPYKWIGFSHAERDKSAAANNGNAVYKNSNGLTAAGKERLGNWSAAIGQAVDFSDQFFQTNKNVANQSTTTKTLNSAYDTTSNGLMTSGNPYAMMAGAIMKAGGMASDWLTAKGVGTDQMTGIDKVLDSKFLKLTPLGLANAIGARSTETFAKDQELQAAQGDAYADAYNDINAAADHAGKKFGRFSRNKMQEWNTKIAQAQYMQGQIDNINMANQDAMAAGGYEGVGLNNQNLLNGGTQMLRAGKEGMKINNIQFAKTILKLKEIPDVDLSFLIESFEQGGALEAPTEKELEEVIIEPFDLESLLNPQFLKEGGSFNVIPEGALHKNLHHIEGTEGLTQKGIPVVTEENGELIQHAEVERNEVIFRLEVTEKLEELKKKAEEAESQEEKDKYAIEAGKLLTKEILHNTHDNTGLIDEVDE